MVSYRNGTKCIVETTKAAARGLAQEVFPWWGVTEQTDSVNKTHSKGMVMRSV
ncbi:hypothetical protein SKAU_G00229400 [Synaphobranchus kaupii]|uniref:Uncharacterized protein n=1 Tax=Synaphobranchus kaupii TaxID=118154 RepID=A0A9Q1F5R0_SYNKA|nr:hypothetical protein SKAU_G00229400 [Synaphobranchus kaupii]